MITKFSHVTLFVLDQQRAYDFYVTTLGFKVGTDATMENGFRWLTRTSSERHLVAPTKSVTFTSLGYHPTSPILKSASFPPYRR